MPNLTKSQEPEPVFFCPLKPEREAEPLEKNTRSRLGKKQEPEPEPLEKKAGAGAAKKFAGSPALPIKVCY